MADFDKQRKKAIEKGQRSLDGVGEMDDKEYGKSVEKRVDAREKVEKIDAKEGKKDLADIERAEKKVEKGKPEGQAELDSAVDDAIQFDPNLTDVAPAEHSEMPEPDQGAYVHPGEGAEAPSPGTYAAEGDPYGYEVLGDGSISIALPQGGTAVVSKDSPGTAYGAIMAQIKGGQLAMSKQPTAPTKDFVVGGAPEEGVSTPMPGPGETTRPPPPQEPPLTIDQTISPSAAMSKIRDQALKRAYPEPV